MLSALILLGHTSTSTVDSPSGIDSAGARRARAAADFLQLYNPTTLISAPDRICTDTLAPLARRLELTIDTSDDLTAEVPKFPEGGSPAHAAAWLASRAVRALPDPRRTAVICADGLVLAALLVAAAAQDAHELASYEFPVPLEGPPGPPPGGGWVLHRDDGRLTDVKPLRPRGKAFAAPTGTG